MSNQVAPCGHRRRYEDGFEAFDSLVSLRHRCSEAKKFDVFECVCGGWHIGLKPGQIVGAPVSIPFEKSEAA